VSPLKKARIALVCFIVVWFADLLAIKAVGAPIIGPAYLIAIVSVGGIAVSAAACVILQLIGRRAR
jgi:hypothetical protein